MTIASYLQGLLNQETQRLKQVEKECLPHFIGEYEHLPERLRNLLPGRDRFIAFNDCLHSMYDKGVRLTALQHRLMNGIRMAACPRIFGEELIYNYAFLETFGIRETTGCLYVLFPRRGGKSTTQQVGTIGQLVTQPNGNYIALSLYARQGYEWLESAHRYLFLLKDDERFDFTVEHDNRELLAIIPKAVGTENTLKTYPGGQGSSYNNLRGIGTQVHAPSCYLTTIHATNVPPYQLSGLIVDEAEFYPVRGLEVILPLLINGAWIIMMSSVGGVSARLGARRLLDAVFDNKSKIFIFYNWFKPCDDCVRKGRGNRCKCNVQQPQFYQSHADVMKACLLIIISLLAWIVATHLFLTHRSAHSWPRCRRVPATESS